MKPMKNLLLAVFVAVFVKFNTAKKI